MVLKVIVHLQSITSAERSVLELYVDMELLHRGAVEYVVDKIITHIDVQKLKAARRVVQFYADNPDLDTNPSYSLPHQDFIAKSARAFGTSGDETDCLFYDSPHSQPVYQASARAFSGAGLRASASPNLFAVIVRFTKAGTNASRKRFSRPGTILERFSRSA